MEGRTRRVRVKITDIKTCTGAGSLFYYLFHSLLLPDKAGHINSCLDAKLDEENSANIGIVMPGAVVAKAMQLGNWFDFWYFYKMVTQNTCAYVKENRLKKKSSKFCDFSRITKKP